MSLFKAELRRLTKRRFARYMTLIGVLILAAVAVGMFFTNQKTGAAQLAQAERAAEADYQQQLSYHQQFIAECERSKASGNSEPNRFPEKCDMMQPPPREAFRAEYYMPATFDFRSEFPIMIIIFASVLALVAFIIGASFIGAEWSSGGMMNLLLWRPKRLQVLLTKLGALITGLTVMSVVVAGLWAVAFWVIANTRGTTAKMTSGVWQSFGLTGLRGIALVLFAGVLGFTLASIGRHTALALGGAIGAIVVGQIGLSIVLNLAQVKFLEAYLVPTYIAAWMQQKVRLEDWSTCNFVMGECTAKTKDITWHSSAWLFGGTLVVLLALSMWTMRRRDVT